MLGILPRRNSLDPHFCTNLASLMPGCPKNGRSKANRAVFVVVCLMAPGFATCQTSENNSNCLSRWQAALKQGEFVRAAEYSEVLALDPNLVKLRSTSASLTRACLNMT